MIDFMIKKGNERKRDQCETASILSKDAQNNILPVTQAIHSKIEIKQNKLEFFDKQRKNLEIELSGLDMA